MRAQCRRDPESREDRKPQATTFGDTITADQKVLNDENESRLNRRYAVVVQDLLNRYRIVRAETRLHLRR